MLAWPPWELGWGFSASLFSSGPDVPQQLAKTYDLAAVCRVWLSLPKPQLHTDVGESLDSAKVNRQGYPSKAYESGTSFLLFFSHLFSLHFSVYTQTHTFSASLSIYLLILHLCHWVVLDYPRLGCWVSKDLEQDYLYLPSHYGALNSRLLHRLVSYGWPTKKQVLEVLDK